MYEAYFGVVRCGRGWHLAWGKRPDVGGAESEQPASYALALAGSLAGEAVCGLFTQAGQADQDDCRHGQGHDDGDDRAYRDPKILQLILHFYGSVVY